MSTRHNLASLGAVYLSACAATVQVNADGGIAIQDAALADDVPQIGPDAAVTTVLVSTTSDSSTLVDFFPWGDTAGVLVIRSDGIDAVRSDGTSVTIPSPREITAATMGVGGQLMAVADRGFVTVYRLLASNGPTPLMVQQTFPVPDACVALAFGNDRLVCAPTTPGAPFILINFGPAGDVTQSQQHASGQAVALRRMSFATEYLVTVEEGGGAHFGLYAQYSWELHPMGSSAVGGAVVSPTFASFLQYDDPSGGGVVDEAGDILATNGPTCGGNGPTVQTSGCLRPLGQLGTLSPSEHFLAMVPDAGAEVFGLVTSRGNDAGCSAGCSVEAIQVGLPPNPSILLSRSTYFADGGTPVGLRLASGSPRPLLFGYNRTRGPGNTPRGYQIDSIVP